jgi:hypothetical protein
MSQKKAITEVILRSYPKVIFFWPLLVTSFILWLLQLAVDASSGSSAPIAWFGYIWFIMFFINIFVIAFDFSSTKFFVLILIAVVVLLLLAFLVLPQIQLPSTPSFEFNPLLSAEFYFLMTIILVFILGIVVISAQFDYWKIEQNEIYHKAGIFTSAERIPTKSLRIKKSIPDVFEFFILRAGTIVLQPGHGDVIPLATVLNINKKQEQIDVLLSHISTEPDELDSQ